MFLMYSFKGLFINRCLHLCNPEAEKLVDRMGGKMKLIILSFQILQIKGQTHHRLPTCRSPLIRSLYYISVGLGYNNLCAIGWHYQSLSSKRRKFLFDFTVSPLSSVCLHGEPHAALVPSAVLELPPYSLMGSWSSRFSYLIFLVYKRL